MIQYTAAHYLSDGHTGFILFLLTFQYDTDKNKIIFPVYPLLAEKQTNLRRQALVIVMNH